MSLHNSTSSRITACYRTGSARSPSKPLLLNKVKRNNFSRWPMLGIKVWPNPQAAGSYDAEVAYVTNYLTLRVAYLDSVFNGKAQTATTITVPSGTLYLGYPVTLKAHVTGATAPKGDGNLLLLEGQYRHGAAGRLGKCKPDDDKPPFEHSHDAGCVQRGFDPCALVLDDQESYGPSAPIRYIHQLGAVQREPVPGRNRHVDRFGNRQLGQHDAEWLRGVSAER